MARVVEIPVTVDQSALSLDTLVQRSTRIGRENVEGRGLDSLPDRPLDGPLEDGRVVLVHAKNEAAIDHHSQVVETSYCLPVVAAEILELALGLETLRVQRLEADEQAAQPAGRRLF